MPIEIKELNIKINVSETAKSTPEKGKEQGIAMEECVDQIMKVIERKKER
jgi:hypothetical protein